MPVSQGYPFLFVRCVTLVSVNSQRVFRLSSSYHTCPQPFAAYLSLGLLHAHILLSHSTLSYQEHVEIAV